MATRSHREQATSSYDQLKEFEGRRYTGMKVGRRHRWHYDPGDWTEKKVTPDRWEFHYAVRKRRAGKAPEGSGAPVGTAYRWYILANQVVTKLDANSYMTEMIGVKHKIAHKRADKETWSASEAAQRRQLVKVLREMADQVERGAEPVAIAAPAARKVAAVKPAAGRRAATADGDGDGAKKATRPKKKRPAPAAAGRHRARPARRAANPPHAVH
jgi:hypothetical protein